MVVGRKGDDGRGAEGVERKGREPRERKRN